MPCLFFEDTDSQRKRPHPLMWPLLPRLLSCLALCAISAACGACFRNAAWLQRCSDVPAGRAMHRPVAWIRRNSCLLSALMISEIVKQCGVRKLLVLAEWQAASGNLSDAGK